MPNTHTQHLFQADEIYKQGTLDGAMRFADELENSMREKDSRLSKAKRTTAMQDIAAMRLRLQMEAEREGFAVKQPPFFKRILRLAKRFFINPPLTREDMRSIGVGLSEAAVFVLFSVAMVGIVTVLGAFTGAF